MHRHATPARLVPTALALVPLVALAAPALLSAQGTMRSLECRGNTGMVIRVDQDPSPRDTADVVMVLEYHRPSKAPGMDTHNLEPGTCSWNPLGSSGLPVEPGRVRFDVRREAQRWSATDTRIMDTTARAAVFFPDPITLPRYLQDPSHYWRFYVNDATNISTSNGALFESGTPTYVTIKGPLVLANNVRRDLLCRGGSVGLTYAGGTNAGNNLAKVILGYRVNASVPGASGYGLSPGSCAWTDRTAMPKEPGRIAFITASNAQLKQIQSGSAVDRSATAAERYPDMNTIPEYLKDPAHYWRFTVESKAPDSALTNGVWKRDVMNIVATGRTPTTSPTVTLPSSVPGGGVFRPGGAGSSSSVTSVFDIRNVVVSPTLENAIIGFDAAPSIAPIVTVTPGAGGASIQIPVQGSAQGTMWRYVGSSKTPLARNTRYNYTINAPATANARANSKSGTFKTLGQRVTIAFTQIYVISDGDADAKEDGQTGDDNGDLRFEFGACPDKTLTSPRVEDRMAYLEWSEGPHTIDAQMKSTSDTTPDHLRVLILGVDHDGNGSTLPPNTYCTSPNKDIQPGRDYSSEWNSIARDIDLTKYPGTNSGERFVWRSKPLRNGSKLMFEVRGSILVTRQ